MPLGRDVRRSEHEKQAADHPNKGPGDVRSPMPNGASDARPSLSECSWPHPLPRQSAPQGCDASHTSANFFSLSAPAKRHLVTPVTAISLARYEGGSTRRPELREIAHGPRNPRHQHRGPNWDRVARSYRLCAVVCCVLAPISEALGLFIAHLLQCGLLNS